MKSKKWKFSNVNLKYIYDVMIIFYVFGTLRLKYKIKTHEEAGKIKHQYWNMWRRGTQYRYSVGVAARAGRAFAVATQSAACVTTLGTNRL
jgi:hypothetical protein